MQWPTFPQVYIDAEFYGGCDIMLGACSRVGRHACIYDCTLLSACMAAVAGAHSERRYHVVALRCPAMLLEHAAVSAGFSADDVL